MPSSWKIAAFLGFALLGLLGFGTSPTVCSAAEAGVVDECDDLWDDLMDLCESDPEWVPWVIYNPLVDGMFNVVCFQNTVLAYCNCHDMHCYPDDPYEGNHRYPDGPPGGIH